MAGQQIRGMLADLMGGMRLCLCGARARMRAYVLACWMCVCACVRAWAGVCVLVWLRVWAHFVCVRWPVGVAQQPAIKERQQARA